MVSSVNFNPMITTTASGSFNVSTEGYVQGTSLDSPNARFNLAGGILAASETLPMWGGIGVSETISAGITGNPGPRPATPLRWAIFCPARPALPLRRLGSRLLAS